MIADVARLRARRLRVLCGLYSCGGLRIQITSDALLLLDTRSQQVRSRGSIALHCKHCIPGHSAGKTDDAACAPVHQQCGSCRVSLQVSQQWPLIMLHSQQDLAADAAEAAAAAHQARPQRPPRRRHTIVNQLRHQLNSFATPGKG